MFPTYAILYAHPVLLTDSISITDYYYYSMTLMFLLYILEIPTTSNKKRSWNQKMFDSQREIRSWNTCLT